VGRLSVRPCRDYTGKCVSVIIPAFEVGQDIVQSVESALYQLDIQVEVIVVDNGGNMSMMKYLKDHYPCVRIVEQPIRGAGPARNMGVELARFEIIAFLDAGDVWKPNKLSTQLKSSPEPNEISGCYATFRLKNGKRIGTSLRTNSDQEATEMGVEASGMPAITSSWCIRKSTFLSLGGFDPSFHNAQDLDFLNRLMRIGGKMTIHREELVDYLLDSKSLTISNYRRQFLSAEYIRLRCNESTRVNHTLLEYLNNTGNFPSKLWFNVHAGRLFRLALLKYGENSYWRAVMFFLISFTLNPMRFLKKLLKQSLLLR
jgi:glycosyltransferase involved in cell wall biosynthesis